MLVFVAKIIYNLLFRTNKVTQLIQLKIVTIFCEQFFFCHSITINSLSGRVGLFK